MTNIQAYKMISSYTKTYDEFKNISDNISTGRKKPDTASIILGEGLMKRSSICSVVRKGIAYTNSMLSTAYNTVSKLSPLAEQALSLAIDAKGKSQDQVVALNASFQSLMKQISSDVSKCTFDGKSLLTGELSGNPSIQKKYSTNAVSINTIPVAAGGGVGFAGGGMARVSSNITVDAQANDTVTIAGHVFTFIAANAEPADQYQVKLGVNNNETARNFIVAINNAEGEGLRQFDYSINNANLITVTKISQSATVIGATIASDNGRNAVAPAGHGGIAAISLNAIRQNSGFIGTVVPNFRLLGTSNAAAPTTALWNSVENIGVMPIAVDANDRGIKIACDIGGELFQGAMIVRGNAGGGAGNTNNYRMKMTSASGQSFTVNYGAGFVGLTAGGVAANEGAAIVADLNGLFAGTVFSQTCSLSLDKDVKDITVNGGVIGSTKGLTASLKDHDFKNLKMEKFDITTVGLNSRFTAVISGKTYTRDFVTANLVKGYKLNLTGVVDANDVLNINLGDRGLTEMTNQERSTAVAQAFSKAFGLGKPLDIRVGESMDDRASISIESLADSRLFVNNAGVSKPKLSLLTAEGCNEAEEVFGNVLKTISRVKADLNSQRENLEHTDESLESSTHTLAKAASAYLDINLQEAVQALNDRSRKLSGITLSMVKNKALEEAELQMLQRM